MTVSSNSAFLPTNELKDIIKSNPQKITLFVSLLFSTISIYFFYSLFNKNLIKKHYEDFFILLGICFFSLIIFLSLENVKILDIFISVTSSISSSGISTYKPPENFHLFYIFLAIIGGSILSNSSGIKFIRIYILLKSTILEIFKLVSPNIIILKTDNKINNQIITSSFLIFISFFISLFILSSVLTTGNLNFEKSFKLSILTLTNTGNSDLYGLKNIDFNNLLATSKIAIILFMIIGKIELISFFLIINKIFNKS